MTKGFAFCSADIWSGVCKNPAMRWTIPVCAGIALAHFDVPLIAAIAIIVALVSIVEVIHRANPLYEINEAMRRENKR